PADESSKPLPAIQDADFRPQIHETVGGRRTGQANPPLDKRPHLSQPLKTLRLVVLERRQLINHDAVKIPAQAILLVMLHQELYIFPVYHVDKSRMVNG